MFRGHVPPIQGSKTHAIVNSAGTKTGRLCEYVRSPRRPCVFFCGSCSDWVGRLILANWSPDAYLGPVEVVTNCSRVPTQKTERCERYSVLRKPVTD
jgi:hypothetical protein